jgi:hypothetical protein
MKIVSTFAIYFTNSDAVLTYSGSGETDQDALEEAWSNLRVDERTAVIEIILNGADIGTHYATIVKAMESNDVDEAFHLLRSIPGIIIEEWCHGIE